jgi:hypothetical protein
LSVKNQHRPKPPCCPPQGKAIHRSQSSQRSNGSQDTTRVSVNRWNWDSPPRFPQPPRPLLRCRWRATEDAPGYHTSDQSRGRTISHRRGAHFGSATVRRVRRVCLLTPEAPRSGLFADHQTALDHQSAQNDRDQPLCTMYTSDVTVGFVP